jgi:uncharacterized protein (DUF58 family)
MNTFDETGRNLLLMKRAPKLLEAVKLGLSYFDGEPMPGQDSITQVFRDALKGLEPTLEEAYAEGRKDEREELLQAIQAAGFDLRTAPNGQVFLLNVFSILSATGSAA